MYNLGEYIRLTSSNLPWANNNGNIVCVEIDAKLASRNNKTQGYLTCYSFTIVAEGWLTLLYNGRELTLTVGDLYIYSPGLSLIVLAASDDYRGLCLLADEAYTHELPTMRDALGAAYFSVVHLGEPVLHLASDDSQHLSQLMRLALRYQQSSNLRRDVSLKLLYELFLNELRAIEEHSVRVPRFPKRVEDLFLQFLRLLPQHFAEHHDIGFYADRLSITTTYLSRIVRQVSGGRTVVDYINQMLLTEVSFLLRQTPLTIAQISDRLHFSEPAAFTRFFHRHKGLAPLQYRKQG